MRESVKALGLIAVIVAVIAAGTSIDLENEQKYVAQHKRVAEFITTQGLQQPPEVPVIGLKNPSYATYWAMVETDDWVLLNGPKGTALCPQVLGPFGFANAPYEAMSVGNLRILAIGYKNKPITLQVFVPRFSTKPAGLEACPGFEHDPATGTLKVGAKKIAYLAKQQPNLTGQP